MKRAARISYKMQIIDPSLPFPEAARRLKTGAKLATEEVALLFCLVLGGHVVQSRSIPLQPKKPAGHHHVSSKVSEAQYQLLSGWCQEEKRKMWLTFSRHVYL
ncbi:MAG TPA: hypothetical protein VHU83_12465 [Bryobacteraceae bacterium]|jgi:hypothetical protein|nr:hypothetical protein [Bryobacteraceae bacterium]